MDWKEIGKKIVQMGAPILGTAVGGPAGGAIGTLVAGLFGVDPNDPKEVMKAIKADPASAIKLQELQNKHQERLEEIALDRYRAGLADVAGARSREAKIVEVTKKKDYYLYGLASLVVLGFFVLCGVLMSHTVPTGQNEVVFMLFGALATGFGTVLQYFFGSSKSSSDKTNLLAGRAKG